jgi:hypothetical protein
MRRSSLCRKRCEVFDELMMSKGRGDSVTSKLLTKAVFRDLSQAKSPRDFAHKHFRSVAVGYAVIHRHCESSESGPRVARYQKIEYTHLKFALHLSICIFFPLVRMYVDDVLAH